ncbi:MAG: right-handed parallel beta-helix repeat-containing protein [Candidatus Bathyarchaeota archaeon]|nr:right-handed parallel beta-helix repeat-containing protein [Candidatus Bathyarchaeota archaeon]
MTGKLFLAVVCIAVVLCGLVLVVDVCDVKASNTIIVPDDYPTIQEAIDNSNANDTIFVKSGNYSVSGYDGLLIDKSLSLVGESSQNTIINVGQYRYGRDGIRIKADNVTVSGFTINGGGTPIGIDIEDSYSNVPMNCKIFNNSIHNCGVAIDAYGSTGKTKYPPSYLTISGNILSGNDRGIYMSASNSTIIGNTIDSNKDVGIIIDDCVFLWVSNNTISNNGFAPYAGNGGGVRLRWPGPFYITRNTITCNHGYGIAFEEFCNNSTIWRNEISKNDRGICEYFVYDGGFGNVVYENNFIDNRQQVAVNQTEYPAVKVNQVDIVALDNGKVGNYWSDYQTKYANASEIDSTGIGKTPYVIDENNIDHYPLLKPINISSISPQPTATSNPTSSPSIPEFPAWIALPLAITTVLIASLIGRRRLFGCY